MRQNQHTYWFEITGGVEQLEFGRIRDHSVHPARENPPYWVFGLVYAGSRTMVVDSGIPVVSRSGEYFLLPPSRPHAGLEADEHDVLFCHFHAACLQAPPPRVIDSQKLVFPLSGSLPGDINCFEYLRYLQTLSKQPYIRPETCAGLFRNLLQLVSIYNQRITLWGNRRIPLSDNIIRFIRENIHRNLVCQHYEKEFGLSYRYLNQVMRAQYQKTIKSIQISFKMDFAATLLGAGKTIEETASLVGFQDYFYFIKCFKRCKGISPGEYKRSVID